MLNRDNLKQQKMIMTTMEDLMPDEHFLRDLDRYVDFDFIYEKVENLYSHTGRRSVEPVIIVKMLLLGYLYGINSERKIEQEVKVNIAYRWFLGIDFDENVPDHSTISQLRRRKFKDSTLFQEIFDEIVLKCVEAGLVTGKLLMTDSTHIKANVDNTKREIVVVDDLPSKYVQRLDKIALEEGIINKKQLEKTAKTKEITKGVTDPDSGILKRPGKPGGFHYLNHQTCDSEFGIITDTYVTAGNFSDNVPHSDRIKHQIEKFKVTPHNYNG